MSHACGFKGNEDLYGLGIRLGFYFSWVAFCVANNFVGTEAPAMRGLNVTFNLALLVALLVEGTRLRTVEVYILLGLSFGDTTLLTTTAVLLSSKGGVFSCPPINFFYERATLAGFLLRLVVSLLFDGYSAYYWSTGIYSMKGSAGCASWGFFFTRVSLLGWLRRFLQVISIIKCLLGFMCLCLFVTKMRWAKIGLSPADVFFSTSPRHNCFRGYKKYPLQGLVLPVANLLSIAIVILSTELTIRWNGIMSVYYLRSAGQLIPAVVGVGSFVKVLFSFAIERPGEMTSDIWQQKGPAVGDNCRHCNKTVTRPL